jgi:hypothetical protein
MCAKNKTNATKNQTKTNRRHQFGGAGATLSVDPRPSPGHLDVSVSATSRLNVFRVVGVSVCTGGPKLSLPRQKFIDLRKRTAEPLTYAGVLHSFIFFDNIWWTRLAGMKRRFNFREIRNDD